MIKLHESDTLKMSKVTNYLIVNTANVPGIWKDYGAIMQYCIKAGKT